jgi:hypothetical protein
MNRNPRADSRRLCALAGSAPVPTRSPSPRSHSSLFEGSRTRRFERSSDLHRARPRRTQRRRASSMTSFSTDPERPGNLTSAACIRLPCRDIFRSDAVRQPRPRKQYSFSLLATKAESMFAGSLRVLVSCTPLCYRFNTASLCWFWPPRPASSGGDGQQVIAMQRDRGPRIEANECSSSRNRHRLCSL